MRSTCVEDEIGHRGKRYGKDEKRSFWCPRSNDRVVQVLSNLLGNALKFTGRGGRIHLCVALRGQQIAFVVRDNGSGISSQALPHVFKRFCQVDSDTRRGLGLGLFICREIVAAHGGRIWVDSEPGQGTVFQFTLPISEVPAVQPAPHVGAGDTTGAAGAGNGRPPGEPVFTER